MARVDLDRFVFTESEVGVKIDVVIKNVLGNAGFAKRSKVGDALFQVVDLAFFNPDGELVIDGDGPFLEDERGVVKIERMADVERVVEGDVAVAGCGMKMDVKQSGFFAEMIESDLVALEVPAPFPEGFIDSCLTESFKLVEEGDFCGPLRRGGVDVFEEFEDVFAVFGDKGKALIAVAKIMEGLI
jgi:hypothetical protein